MLGCLLEADKLLKAHHALNGASCSISVLLPLLQILCHNMRLGPGNLVLHTEASRLPCIVRRLPCHDDIVVHTIVVQQINPRVPDRLLRARRILRPSLYGQGANLNAEVISEDLRLDGATPAVTLQNPVCICDTVLVADRQAEGVKVCRVAQNSLLHNPAQIVGGQPLCELQRAEDCSEEAGVVRRDHQPLQLAHRRRGGHRMSPSGGRGGRGPGRDGNGRLGEHQAVPISQPQICDLRPLPGRCNVDGFGREAALQLLATPRNATLSLDRLEEICSARSILKRDLAGFAIPSHSQGGGHGHKLRSHD
mmetsp:Transcript_52723/g.133875  ORF Transcript_52723/g.133875 Transcript_52723/m.133875 type:complete len:308 (+) Transcript_52723:162-1085(+)